MYQQLVNLLDPFLLFFLLTALALLNLWRDRSESRRRLLLVTIPFLGLLAACTPAVSHFAIGSLEWSYPPQSELPEDAEAIVVLACNMRAGNDVRPEPQVGSDTLYRCLHAAELYRQDPSRVVIVSGGQFTADDSDPTAAEVMRDFLVQLGISKEDVIVEGTSTNTYENAVETAKQLRERQIEKIVLVTDAVDLLRAERCFQAQEFEVVPSGCQYRATEFRWRVSTFLPSSGAAKGTHRAVHEWLGMAWYWWNGRI